MKKILSILLVSVILFGCTENKRYTKSVKRHYENGQLKSEGNWKDGKMEGLWKYYYENGQLELEGNQKDGKTDGLWKKYYENGQLKYESIYKNGNKIE